MTWNFKQAKEDQWEKQRPFVTEYSHTQHTIQLSIKNIINTQFYRSIMGLRTPRSRIVPGTVEELSVETAKTRGWKLSVT